MGVEEKKQERRKKKEREEYGLKLKNISTETNRSVLIKANKSSSKTDCNLYASFLDFKTYLVVYNGVRRGRVGVLK